MPTVENLEMPREATFPDSTAEGARPASWLPTQSRPPLRISRGLFRLWVVGAVIWACAIFLAFWSGNGGMSAGWVWELPGGATPPPSLAEAPSEFPRVSASQAEMEKWAASRKTLSFDKAMNTQAPPSVISVQLPSLLVSLLLPPGLILAVGVSLTWAVRGFRA